ncbi:MAG TPA: hypothetical protein VIV60_20925 [Polyangiaceae bacterium]
MSYVATRAANGDYSRGELISKASGAIDSIASFLRFHRADPSTVEKREKLEAHVTYIENNNDRMRYRKMRLRGLPIGSGVTESACKTLVNMRAKGAGQRWHCSGLRGALNLRAMSHALPSTPNRALVGVPSTGLNACDLSDCCACRNQRARVPNFGGERRRLRNLPIQR